MRTLHTIPMLLVISSACFAYVPPALGHDAQGVVDVAGVRRTYATFVPDRLAAGGGHLPLVIVLHGGFGSGAMIRRQMRMDEVAEREGFAIAYPDGLQRAWNDGRNDMLRWRATAGGVDDVAFLKGLVQKLAREGLADPARVYLMGVSNGGMMSLRMACEAPELFAAVAPIIASLPADIADSCRPARPIAMLLINGTADPLVPWEGGGVGFAGKRGKVLSTAETIAFWRRVNGCSEHAVHSKPSAERSSETSRAEAMVYRDCRSGAPVALVRIEGGGHRIPGREAQPHPWIDRLLGAQNHDFEAAEIVWQFFAKPAGS